MSGEEADIPKPLDPETAQAYRKKCCVCRYFQAAYHRVGERTGLMWVDDPGWCVRYPPTRCQLKEPHTGEVEDHLKYFSQPVVQGGDECGEFKRAKWARVVLGLKEKAPK